VAAATTAATSATAATTHPTNVADVWLLLVPVGGVEFARPENTPASASTAAGLSYFS
jgi:hypothetical protein